MAKYRIQQQLAIVVEKNEEQEESDRKDLVATQKQNLIEPVIVKKVKPVESPAAMAR